MHATNVSWALRSPLDKTPSPLYTLFLHDWTGLKEQKVQSLNGSTQKAKSKRAKLLTPEIFRKLRERGEKEVSITRGTPNGNGELREAGEAPRHQRFSI